MDRPLRRAAAEITDSDELDEILHEARVLFLSLHDEPAPYVVPVCFGYIPGILYVHSGREGAKMDLMRAHPRVGFSACTDMTVAPGATACAFTCRARSVCGTGVARIVEEEEERVRGLETIMRHYAGGPDAPVDFTEQNLSRTCVIAIRVDALRGKRIG